jgi:hypothetical protein
MSVHLQRRACVSVASGVLAALAVALCVLAAWAPTAGALEPAFVVNAGDEYARGPHVTVGDGGWTPFFRPGVVVWDGGSIIAGHPSEPAYRFPAQTLSLVPRACESFLSVTPGARIDDMLEEGPAEVDARFEPEADLNVCLVLAGGGDFRAGVTAAFMYTSLRSYCKERRAAGFRVLVLTVLPCHRTDTFEVTRLAFNAMLRDGWDDFAHGLVDIGADSRIGDTGDEYDAQFYLTDQLHLTAAGNAVMASLAAPVLAGQPWLSAGCELRTRDAAGVWGEWRPWSASTSLWLDDYQGEHVVEAEYRLDGGEPVTMSDTIFLDTVRPQALALRTAAVRRGKTAVLRYRMDDLQPCGPTGTAVVELRTKSGRLLRTFVRRRVPIGRTQQVSFTCTLPKGTYRWVVSARDTAGNSGVAPDEGKLIVR